MADWVEKQARKLERKARRKQFVKAHGAQISRVTVGWSIIGALVAIFGYATYTHFDIVTLGKWYAGKFSTGVGNIMILDLSIIFFCLAFGSNALWELLNCKRAECSTEDRRNALYLIIALIVTHAYLLGLGA